MKNIIKNSALFALIFSTFTCIHAADPHAHTPEDFVPTVENMSPADPYGRSTPKLTREMFEDTVRHYQRQNLYPHHNLEHVLATYSHDTINNLYPEMNINGGPLIHAIMTMKNEDAALLLNEFRFGWCKKRLPSGRYRGASEGYDNDKSIVYIAAQEPFVQLLKVLLKRSSGKHYKNERARGICAYVYTRQLVTFVRAITFFQNANEELLDNQTQQNIEEIIFLFVQKLKALKYDFKYFEKVLKPILVEQRKVDGRHLPIQEEMDAQGIEYGLDYFPKVAYLEFEKFEADQCYIDIIGQQFFLDSFSKDEQLVEEEEEGFRRRFSNWWNRKNQQ